MKPYMKWIGIAAVIAIIAYWLWSRQQPTQARTTAGTSIRTGSSTGAGTLTTFTLNRIFGGIALGTVTPEATVTRAESPASYPAPGPGQATATVAPHVVPAGPIIFDFDDAKTATNPTLAPITPSNSAYSLFGP